MLGRFRRSFLIIACMMSMVSAIVAQTASTTVDDKFSFSTHKRYAGRENRLVTREHPDTNELMDLKIVRAVNQLLAGKDFIEVKDKPDFYLYYEGGGSSQATAGGQDRVNSRPLVSNDSTPTYGLGNGPAMAPSTWLKVSGRIVFHIIDADSRKPLWESIYTKKFHDPDKAMRNMDKEVNELVSKSFKNFPPKSPNP